MELKTDARLRPNWNYVARRVGFSIEQCKARWEELQEPQRQQELLVHSKKTRVVRKSTSRTEANWDAGDGDADVRLVELKTDARLRPNWNYVARRVGFSIEQCKARWEELQEPEGQSIAQCPAKP